MTGLPAPRPGRAAGLAVPLAPVAGIVVPAAAAMAVGMGVGRFVYTPILPLMTARAGLSPQWGAAIATANYAGYLAGAMAGVAAPALLRSRAAYRSSLIVVMATLALMPLLSSDVRWAALRFVAGCASALVFMIAASALLTGLRGAGEHVVGQGFGGVGIAASGVLVLVLRHRTWQDSWWSAAVLGAVLIAVAWLLRPSASDDKGTDRGAAPADRRWFTSLAVALGAQAVGIALPALVGGTAAALAGAAGRRRDRRGRRDSRTGAAARLPAPPRPRTQPGAGRTITEGDGDGIPGRHGDHGAGRHHGRRGRRDPGPGGGTISGSDRAGAPAAAVASAAGRRRVAYVGPVPGRRRDRVGERSVVDAAARLAARHGDAADRAPQRPGQRRRHEQSGVRRRGGHSGRGPHPLEGRGRRPPAGTRRRVVHHGRDLSGPASLHRGSGGSRRVLRRPADGHDRGVHAPRGPHAERWPGARLPHCRLRFQRPRHPHRVPQRDHPPGPRRLADRALPGVAPRLRSQRRTLRS